MMLIFIDCYLFEILMNIHLNGPKNGNKALRHHFSNYRVATQGQLLWLLLRHLIHFKRDFRII